VKCLNVPKHESTNALKGFLIQNLIDISQGDLDMLKYKSSKQAS